MSAYLEMAAQDLKVWPPAYYSPLPTARNRAPYERECLHGQFFSCLFFGVISEGSILMPLWAWEIPNNSGAG